MRRDEMMQKESWALVLGARTYFGDGAAYRTRTCDPRITNAMLYQLS